MIRSSQGLRLRIWNPLTAWCKKIIAVAFLVLEIHSGYMIYVLSGEWLFTKWILSQLSLFIFTYLYDSFVDSETSTLLKTNFLRLNFAFKNIHGRIFFSVAFIFRYGIFKWRWPDVPYSTVWEIRRGSSSLLCGRNCIRITLFAQERHCIQVSGGFFFQ